MKSKWRILCAGLAAAGVLAAGLPGERMPVAEAMYSAVDASHHWYKTPSEQQKLFLLAIRDGDYATVENLINSGIDVNGVYKSSVGEPYDNPGATPLYVAIVNRQRDIMQLLLDNGADVNGYYTFTGGYLPYVVLVSYSYYRDEVLDALQYLHNWGASLNSVCTLKGWNQGDAVDYLTDRICGYNDFYDALTYVLQQGANPNGAGKERNPTFMRAVYYGHNYRNYRLIDIMAAYGANVLAYDSSHKDAMDYALSVNDLNLYKYVKAVMERGTQPSIYQPPAGASVSGSATQAKIDRSSSLGKFVDTYKKYSDASDEIYNNLEAAIANPSAGVTKEQLSKENDAIKQLKKLNEKMAKEEPLKGMKGYSVGEREKFTDLFDGLGAYNDAMIAFLEYTVAHPTDGDHDQLVHLTAQVLKCQMEQKDRLEAVKAVVKK